MNSTSGRFAAAQSRAARMPASGPGKFSTVSAMTGSPNAANRAGSPLALRMSLSHCGFSRAMTRSRIVRPPIWRIGLSPPPIRRARPPASNTPGVAGASLDVAGNSLVTLSALALVTRGFFFDEGKILIVDDPLLAGQRDEALAARAPDKRKSNLPRQVDTPRRKARTRDQNGNPHPHRLDHHLGSQPSSRVKNLVGGIDPVAIDPACDLVDGVVATDVLGITDRRALLSQHAAVDRPGLEVEARHGVAPLLHLVKPRVSPFPARHDGDDLLGVEIQRQRPLHRNIDLDFGPGLVGSGDAFGQPRIVRIGDDQGDGRFVDLHHHWQASMTFP